MYLILEFLRLVEAEHSGMRVHIYKDALDGGEQRKGQAFMNALRGTPYYDQLIGTYMDPFYLNTDGAIINVINYLTTKR